jgi:hypothetical protein
MTESELPPPPEGTGPSGCRLWTDVLGKYELEQHETALLIEMVRTVDTLDELASIVELDGLMVPGQAGVPRVHPAVVESRQLRLALARLSASLRLPAGDEQEQGGKGNLRRPQRRGAARGTYGIRGVA